MYKKILKYRNIKTEYKGRLFDSKKEMSTFASLELLQRVGEISDLECQKTFELQEGYVNNKGEKIRPIKYIADFFYFDKKIQKWKVIDVKSPATRTDVYRIKKKLFEYKFPEYMFEEM